MVGLSPLCPLNHSVAKHYGGQESNLLFCFSQTPVAESNRIGGRHLLSKAKVVLPCTPTAAYIVPFTAFGIIT